MKTGTNQIIDFNYGLLEGSSGAKLGLTPWGQTRQGWQEQQSWAQALGKANDSAEDHGYLGLETCQSCAYSWSDQ
jgi:hypothetical protein